jgi:methionine-gamma-lyase
MVTFDVGDGAAARRVLSALRAVRYAPSLGDTATTISYPVATSHRGAADPTGEIHPGILRLSTGIDHVDDVWSDLNSALG